MKKILGSLTVFLIAFSCVLAEEVPYTNRSFASFDKPGSRDRDAAEFSDAAKAAAEPSAE